MKRHLYPDNWEKISAFVRYSRAGNHCEWCGAWNGKPHPITGSHVVLTVAHVYDKDPGNCRLLNLAALCQRCHLRHDRKRSWPNVYPPIPGKHLKGIRRRAVPAIYFKDRRNR